MRQFVLYLLGPFLMIAACAAQSPATEKATNQASIPTVTTQRVVVRVPAKYPETARQLHVTGMVRLLVTIDEGGSVIGADVLSGDPLLTQAAVDAVLKWKFAPYVVDGRPTKARTEVQVPVNEAAGPPMVSGIVSTTPILPLNNNSQRIRVSQMVAEQLVIAKVPPNYPPLARQARIQGAVVLWTWISKEGSVQSVKLISGHPMLAPAAIDAVKQWAFKPYLLNGEPADIESQITVNFLLDQAKTLQ